MTDVAVTSAPAGDIVVLDLWGGAPPASDVRMLRVEPARWWLIDAGAALGEIEAAIAGRGALAPVGGGLVRFTLDGPGWREHLMLSAFFDAEDPAFGPGAVAGTVIHHVPVRIAPVGDTRCEVFAPASYASTLEHLWRGPAQGG